MPSRTDSAAAPYDHGHHALLTLFVGGPALGTLVTQVGIGALLAGFPAVVVLAVAMEAIGRRRDPSRDGRILARRIPAIGRRVKSAAVSAARAGSSLSPP